MKHISILFVLATVLFASCEGPIYHQYIIENNSDKDAEINFTFINNPDSLISVTIEKDSSKVIFETSDMQGFFTEKIPPHYPTEIFGQMFIKNDSVYNSNNFFSDSLWSTSYKPGTYTYLIKILQ